MFEVLIQFTALSPVLLILISLSCFLAGVVRGFTGFGLSAVLVGVMAAFVAPVELLPIAILLEAASRVSANLGPSRGMSATLCGRSGSVRVPARISATSQDRKSVV